MLNNWNIDVLVAKMLDKAICIVSIERNKSISSTTRLFQFIQPGVFPTTRCPEKKIGRSLFAFNGMLFSIELKYAE